MPLEHHGMRQHSERETIDDRLLGQIVLDARRAQQEALESGTSDPVRLRIDRLRRQADAIRMFAEQGDVSGFLTLATEYEELGKTRLALSFYERAGSREDIRRLMERSPGDEPHVGTAA